MRRAPKHDPGTSIRIPLADGTSGYDRVLDKPYMAFYHYRTSEPSSDLDAIGSKPLERAAVRELHHLEERLLDTFNSRPNEAGVRACVRLEDLRP